MFHKVKKNGDVVKRKSKAVPRLLISLAILLFVSVLSFFTIRFFNSPERNKTSKAYIYKKWAENDYKAVYDACTEKLKIHPYNNLALTFKGYSGFYLSVSQIDSSLAREYLDDSIFNLRVALQTARKSLVPQLSYMLGKCYFYKNSLSSYYYYSDLAIRYLEEARTLGYKSDDIYEYLGLCYASLGKTSESIASFTEALLVRNRTACCFQLRSSIRKPVSLRPQSNICSALLSRMMMRALS